MAAFTFTPPSNDNSQEGETVHLLPRKSIETDTSSFDYTTHVSPHFLTTPPATMYLIPDPLRCHPPSVTTTPNLHLTSKHQKSQDKLSQSATPLLFSRTPSSSPKRTLAFMRLIPTIKLPPHSPARLPSQSSPNFKSSERLSPSEIEKTDDPEKILANANTSYGHSRGRGLKQSYSLPVLPPLDRTPPISDSLLRLPVFVGSNPHHKAPTTTLQTHQQHQNSPNISSSPTKTSSTTTNTTALKPKKKRFAGARSMLNLSFSLPSNYINEEEEPLCSNTAPNCEADINNQISNRDEKPERERVNENHQHQNDGTGGDLPQRTRMQDLRLKTEKAWKAISIDREGISRRFGFGSGREILNVQDHHHASENHSVNTTCSTEPLISRNF